MIIVASDISEANLVAYLNGSWDESVIVKPTITYQPKCINNKNSCVVIRRRPVPGYIAANVKQITETFEIWLNTASKDAMDHLEDLLLAYPGIQPALYANGFEAAVTDFTMTDIMGGSPTMTRSSTYKHAGSYSMKLTNTIGVTKATRTLDAEATSISFEMLLKKGTDALTGSAMGAQVLNTAGSVIAWITYSGSVAATELWAYGVKIADGIADATWLSVTFTFDLVNEKYSLYVDGVLKVANAAWVTAGDGGMQLSFWQAYNHTMYYDDVAVSVPPGIDLNRVPVEIDNPEYLGQDNAENHVHRLDFKATRWE